MRLWQICHFFKQNISELKDDINMSVDEVCRHYNVPVIKLKNIDKQSGHPSVKGMKSIADQVLQVIRR